MNQHLERWKAAWESLDPEKVATLYAPNATHRSAMVERIYPELGRSELRGREEIREYARRAFTRFTAIRFEIAAVIEDDKHAAVEYRRFVNTETEATEVLEMIEWSNDLLTACRVFHF
jgi:nuclear transport factor 2 (NTF2) superfamily protein